VRWARGNLEKTMLVMIVASGFCIAQALKQALRLSQFGIAESPA
jgi:hypothetical protein